MKALNCPICRKTVTLGEPFFPFCSERCKLIDLGNWAMEKYVITRPLEPGEIPDDAGDDEA